MMRGFTLIETTIYIALLSIIMTGVLVSVYDIISSGSLIADKTTTEDEGNFVLGKLAWTFGDVKMVSPTGYFSTPITITRTDGVSTVQMRLNNGVIEMKENGGSYTPVTTSNVNVSALAFYYGGGYIEASTTIDGKPFTLRRYLP
jgi:hypothetical protein